MLKQFDQYKIVTNGKKYRIEGRYLTSNKEPKWIYLSSGYYGCDSYGYLSILGGIHEFESRDEAVDFIRKEYGEHGIRKLEETWWTV